MTLDKNAGWSGYTGRGARVGRAYAGRRTGRFTKGGLRLFGVYRPWLGAASFNLSVLSCAMPIGAVFGTVRSIRERLNLSVCRALTVIPVPALSVPAPSVLCKAP